MPKVDKEKLAMLKGLKDVNNPWEAVCFLYVCRKRELFQTLFLISFVANIIMAFKYTSAASMLMKLIKGLI